MEKVHSFLPKIHLLALVLLVLTSSLTSAEEIKRVKRVSNTLANVLGIRQSNTPSRRKPPVKITPPLRLSPGETAVQAPGWQHCIKRVKATMGWKSIKSPGYPDFLESQIQCSWIIEAPIGFKVKLAFRDLDMVGTTGTCAKQFVQIIDVGTGKSQGRFCGSTRPGDYVTLATKARLDLQADKAVTKSRGFLLSFTAAKEIPGFRSTKSLPPAFTGTEGAGAPGKVNLKNFVSNNNNNNNFPKPYQGPKGSARRLVYESDRAPLSTDPDAPATESVPTNTLGSDSDFGWIGSDENIGTGLGAPRNPSGGPLKVPTGNRPRPRPRPSQSSNGPIVITQSTLPVRITFKRVPTPAPTEEYAEFDSNDGPVIYGADRQPYDPSVYTTEYPVQHRQEVLDHRPETLTTTSLIIIVACCGIFLFMILAAVAFWWIYRKRQIKKKKRAKAEKKKKAEQEELRRGNQPEIEMKVLNLGDEKPIDRERHLPMPHQSGEDLPPRYQRHSEYPYPRDGDMERRGSMHDPHPREGGVRRSSFHDPYPRDGGVERRISRPEEYGNLPFQEARPELPPREPHRREDETRRSPRHDMPSHIQLRHEDLRHQEMMHREDRQRYPGGQRHPNDDINYRRRTLEDMQRPREEPLRHRPPSPIRHQTLDPRRLQMQRDPHFGGRRHGPPMDRPRYPSNPGPRYPPGHVRGDLPRVDSRPLPPLPPHAKKTELRHNDVDEDYCSGVSDASGKKKAPMRREYSPWELEQQKQERKKKLINGEL